MGYAVVAIVVLVIAAAAVAYVVRRRTASSEPGPIARRLAEAEPSEPQRPGSTSPTEH